MKLLASLFFVLPSLIWASWEIKQSSMEMLILQWDGGRSNVAKVEAVIGVPAGSRITFDYKLENKTVLSGGQTWNGVRPTAFKPSVKKMGQFRDLELAGIEFNPVFTVGKNVYRAGQIIFSVHFSSQLVYDNPRRSSFPAPQGHPAEEYLKNYLLNYQQSRNFRTVENFSARPLAKSAASLEVVGRRLVVHSSEEKIYTLEYETLKAAAVPVDNLDPRKIKLVFEGFQVPIYIHGENDGRFDSGDYIEFIGKKPSGSLLEKGARSYNSFYSSFAVMYLSWDNDSYGLRAALSPVPGSVGGVLQSENTNTSSLNSFPVKLHLEKDQKIIRLGGVAVGDVVDLGSSVRTSGVSDFWFWANQGSNQDAADIPFHLEYSPLRPENKGGKGDSARITLRLQGITDVLTAPMDHHIKFLLNSHDISVINGKTNEALWAGTDAYLWTSDYFPTEILKSGANVLTLQKINDLKTTDGAVVEVQDAYLDYIQLEFSSELKAVDNYLRFNNNYPEEKGLKNFVIRNLTEGDYSLWDREGRKLSGFNLISTGGGKQLSFSDDQSAFTEYLLAEKSDFLKPEVYLDTIVDLKNGNLQADYIVITQKKLLGSALDSLIDLRESQGLSVKTVLADHIYANFGDGTSDPASIKNFLRYAYKNWRRPAPIYVLLLGETSMWFNKTAAGKAQNIVPTHLIHIPGWGVTSNDDYYAKLSGDDNIQDIWIGRIPAVDKSALSGVVKKILDYENRRPNGHWQNKALLLGGFESIFTRNNNNLQSILVEENRHFSRWDVEANSPYYRPRGVGPSLFEMMDSAFNIVSFTGHGGGSVWSDAGMLTLDELDADSLRADFAIPLVTSFTCLTGFFEDVDYRSLGEEMLRYKRGGSLSFYGASGYISSAAGSILSEQVFKQALTSGTKSVGQIIATAENMVTLLSGLDFAPILGEFDLLGDPAMPITFPDIKTGLVVEGTPSANAPGLFVSQSDIKMDSPEGVVSVVGDDSVYFSRPLTFSGADYNENFQFKKKPGGDFPVINEGKALSHIWNEDKSEVYSGKYNSLDWLIDSLTWTPKKLLLNSSVKIGFKLEKLEGDISLNGGSVAFYVGSAASAEFLPQEEILLRKKSGEVLETVNEFKPLKLSSNIKDPVLYFRVRMSLSVNHSNGSITELPGIQSRIYSAPFTLPSDLQPAKTAFTVPVQNKLGVWAHFKNSGAGSDSGFTVQLKVLENGEEVKNLTDVYGSRLESGRQDSLFFPLSNGDLKRTLRLSLIPSDSLLESRSQNNQADSSLDIYTAHLSGESQRLYGKDSSIYIINKSGTARRFFIETEPLGTVNLPQHLSPAEFQDENFYLYHINWTKGVRAQFELYSAHSPVLKKGKPAPAYWHYFLSDQSQWLKLDSLKGEGGACRLYKPGKYSMYYNSDVVLPKIGFSAQGQFLLQEDYVPQNSPLQITLKDDVGLDYYIHPPELHSSNREIDSSTTVNSPLGVTAKSAVIQYSPKGGIERDSLTVIAYDVSGNRVEESLVYKKGRGLNIRLYGSYPNPFADSAIIVYQLTDWADKVSLKIYSRAGRLVKKIEEPAGTGYREIVWNGKDEGGHSVANGLYYLKVMAYSGDHSTSSLFKMFRMKRK